MTARRGHARAGARPDHYATLGVAPDADAAAIKAAYRRRSTQAHPDKPGGSHEKMQAINAAYDVLSDKRRRAAYDAGQDDPHHRPTLEERAQRALVEMFTSAIASPSETDLLAAVNGMISVGTDAAIASRRQLERAIRRLQAHQGKVIRKDGGYNLVEDVISGQLQQQRRQLDQVLEALELFALARRLMADFESVSPTAAPDNFETLFGPDRAARGWASLFTSPSE